MDSEQDLPPLSRELDSLLAEARSGDPRAAELASLRGRIKPLLEGSGGSGAATSAPGVRSMTKMALGALVGTALVGALVVISLRAPEEPAVRVEPRRPTPAAVTAPVDHPSQQPASSALEPDAPREPEHAPAKSALRPRRPRASAASVPSSTSNVVALESAEPELEEAPLVESARRAARTDPARALRLLAEHRRNFPDGALRMEARVVEIEALVHLGQRDQAERLARDFLERERGTAYRHRIERIFDLNP